MEEANKTGRALVPADFERAFVRRDGGSSLLKCGKLMTTGATRLSGLMTVKTLFESTRRSMLQGQCQHNAYRTSTTGTITARWTGYAPSYLLFWFGGTSKAS